MPATRSAPKGPPQAPVDGIGALVRQAKDHDAGLFQYPQREYFTEVEVERKQSVRVCACPFDQLAIRGALRRRSRTYTAS
jgi:hypothetical protein